MGVLCRVITKIFLVSWTPPKPLLTYLTLPFGDHLYNSFLITSSLIDVLSCQEKTDIGHFWRYILCNWHLYSQVPLNTHASLLPTVCFVPLEREIPYIFSKFTPLKTDTMFFIKTLSFGSSSRSNAVVSKINTGSLLNTGCPLRQADVEYACLSQRSPLFTMQIQQARKM